MPSRTHPAAALLDENPRVFWGRVIRVLIERGWNPPPPDERIVDELLDAMQEWTPAITEGTRAAAESIEILTPAESRIAYLVSQGQTNEAIADELEIAVGTVKFHLSNVYRKLGLSSRTELAVALATSSRSRPAA